MQEITKNISWEFTDRKVTAWGGMRMFKEFLDRTEISKVLRKNQDAVNNYISTNDLFNNSFLGLPLLMEVNRPFSLTSYC